MFTKVTLERLEIYSVYKLMLIGLTCSMIPLGVVFGVLAFFGANTVTWNGQPLHGFAALLSGPAIGAVIALTTSFSVGTACFIGLWLYSKAKPLSLWAKGVAHHP